MRRALLISLTTLHLVAGVVQAAGDNPDGLAVTFVIDTRWSCGDDMPEFRTLVRQGLLTVGPQDYVEILTAHSGRPRIRLAQGTYRGMLDQVAAANRMIDDIHEGFLAGANVSRALKMALDRLESTCSKQGYKKAVVVILTDGRLGDSDVAGVLKLAAEFRKRDWPLYITGNSNTNKNLLIAANKGKIHWSATADAQPVLWLRQARTSVPEPANRPEGPTEEKKTYPVPSSTRRPSTMGGSPLRAIPRRPTTPPEKPLPRLQDGITTRSRTEVEVTFPGGPLPGAGPEPTKPSVPKEQSIAPTAPREPNRPTKADQPTDTGKKKAVSLPRQPLWPRVKRLIARFWPWLIAGIFMTVLGVIGYMISRGGRRAKQILVTVGRIVKERPKDDGMLIATINGLTRQLGRRSRLRPTYVGSGVRNTLRVTEKGVSNRHLCLYQKAGQLMLQNLSSKPVTVSGLAVQPKAKKSLALPVVIELTENVRLRLSIQRPSDSTPSQGNESHEQSKPRQKMAHAVSH